MIRAKIKLQHSAISVTHTHNEERAAAARTIQGFFLAVAVQKKAALRSATHLFASWQEAVRIATRTQVATKIQHFARSVSHVHDEERATATRPV